KSFQVAFSRNSQEITGTPHNKNIVALGVLLEITGISEEQAIGAITGDHEVDLLKNNLAALEAGKKLFFELSIPSLRLSRPQDYSKKVIIQGNTAMAQAAIRADCKAFFGYPITPAAEIMKEMENLLQETGGIFLQAEDEIASAGLVIGASLAGAKSVTCTSGPGLDLMTEMMGLAVAAEIPMVIIDVQRCGPSTGIPSKSEQSDLYHAVYGGHGDTPRVVLAPYNVEGCYRLVIEGIGIAQYYQTVVVLLSDQSLGQTLVAVNDEFLTREYAAQERKRPSGDDIQEYHRYRLTDDFISPMAVAGDEESPYQTSGLTHNETGAPSFDFETHQRMHQKRWHKLMPLRQRGDLVKLFGNEEADRGIITWGSSAQVVLETVEELGLQNTVKVCVPELICPLPQQVESFLKSTQKLLVVEMNYSGQLYHYLRSQIDLPGSTDVYARAGGRPFSKKELAGPIARVGENVSR
ncbi:MAG: 2-oxoacid:acceptor oxidoreductase subunit alpha, partial [Chloroflexota bacterium]|nr:2-oxoacid:acceptor oxidoreductase subunit alpha [Chloroflexota bacterium]